MYQTPLKLLEDRYLRRVLNRDKQIRISRTGFGNDPLAGLGPRDPISMEERIYGGVSVGGVNVGGVNVGGANVSNKNKQSKIQSILFDKNKWHSLKAQRWLKKHDYKSLKKVHITDKYLRYRIREPKDDAEYKIINLDDYIKAVIMY